MRALYLEFTTHRPSCQDEEIVKVQIPGVLFMKPGEEQALTDQLSALLSNTEGEPLYCTKMDCY